MDRRFANDPAYLFSAVSHIENFQLQRNIPMSVLHGSKAKGEDNTNTLQMKDAYFVFTKIKNTPQYWKLRKMELLARLDNFGPFQFFFTLSCADGRWDENFISSMNELGIKVSFELDQYTGELATKLTIGEETVELDEYLNNK